MNKPLMPMATAVWLVEHTTLTFRQIARFTGLHELEVQAIADETIGQNIVGMDPTLSGPLSKEEIARCEGDETQDLVLIIDEVPAKARTKGPRYTPVSKRQDKPDAIAWLVRHHPELSDGQIGKLIGTTKPTITAIRDRSHWNISNITPKDPVGLGLCSQIDLDAIVQKVAEKIEKANKKAGIVAPTPEEEENIAAPAPYMPKLFTKESKADAEPFKMDVEPKKEEERAPTAAEAKAEAEALFSKD